MQTSKKALCKTGKIEYIRYYKCGSCINNEHIVFKHSNNVEFSRRKEFNAGVFLIKHINHGYILFDLGYSMENFRCGFKGFMYDRLNPIQLKVEDEIDCRLSDDGIRIDDIRYIILSHMHPDHIGALKYFKNVKKIFVSKGVYSEYTKNKKSSLIFNNLVPDWFGDKVKTLSGRTAYDTIGNVCDLFNDGSILLKLLPGHAKSQVGALIDGKLFIGADASWGCKYLFNNIKLGVIGSLIQDNMKKYESTTDELLSMIDKGIYMVFSHDNITNMTNIMENGEISNEIKELNTRK